MTKQGVRIGLAVVATLGAMAAQASFQAPAGAAARAGVVRYAAQSTGAAHVVLKGTKVPGGCRFTATGSSIRDTAVRQVETAFDATTCTSYLDRTAVPAGTAATGSTTTAGGSGRGSGRAGARAVEGAVSAQVARCVNPYRNTAISYSRDACVHSWFQDASGVHVNEVRSEVQWNPSGGCANTGAAYASNYFVGAAGWTNYLNTWSPSFSCAGVVSQSSVGYVNSSFCGSYAIDRFDPSSVTGRADGSYAWSVTWYKTASCTLAFGQLDES